MGSDPETVQIRHETLRPPRLWRYLIRDYDSSSLLSAWPSPSPRVPVRNMVQGQSGDDIIED